MEGTESMDMMQLDRMRNLLDDPAYMAVAVDALARKLCLEFMENEKDLSMGEQGRISLSLTPKAQSAPGGFLR